MASSSLIRDILMSAHQEIDDNSPPPRSIRNAMHVVPERDPHFTTTRRRPYNPWNAPPQEWAEQRVVLASLVSGREFVLGHPSEGMIARRREWDRRTNRGQNVDYSWNGSIENQMRFRWWAEKRRKSLTKRGLQPLPMEAFKPVQWDRPATLRSESVSPMTLVPREMEVDPFDMGVVDDHARETPSVASIPSSLDQLIPKAPGAQKTFEEVTNNGSDSKWSVSSNGSYDDDDMADSSSISEASLESYESFMNWFYAEEERIAEARAQHHEEQFSIADTDSQTSLVSLTESEEPVVEEATTARVVCARRNSASGEEIPIIAQATTARVLHAPYIPVPPRNESLLTRTVLQAGLASRDRRSRQVSAPEGLSREDLNKSLSVVAETTRPTTSSSPFHRQSHFVEMFSEQSEDSISERKVRKSIWTRVKKQFLCLRT